MLACGALTHLRHPSAPDQRAHIPGPPYFFAMDVALGRMQHAFQDLRVLVSVIGTLSSLIVGLAAAAFQA